MSHLARRLIIVILLLCGSAAAQQPHTLTGDIRLHKNFHSKILNNDRDIIVYLPPGYDANKTARYSVRYLHDGQAVIPDDCLADCKGQVAIRFLGESEAIDGLPEEMPDFWKAGLSDGVRRLIETEIAARGEYVRSLIDIVRISPNGAQWIQKKTECAELQPQGKSQQPGTLP